ncbi:MAG: Hpt domain-containing protein [Burkholderiales bacterium]|jgi:chemosensory pili system protein ChpA (sensor histidine kinase/response regulator)|nr:Hpt domain-containing protein [Burkholderiales bacterium]
MSDTVSGIDLSALSWVQGEIDQSLTHGLESLAVFKQTPSDHTALQRTRMHFRQAVGAIQMIGLESLAVFSGEIELQLDRLGALPPEQIRPIADCVERASRKLQTFLAETNQGAQLSPLMLFPEYEAMQQQRNLRESNPADLFFPDLSYRLDDGGPQIAVDRKVFPVFLVKKRRVYERGLLDWLRGNHDGVEAMREVAEDVQTVTAQHANRTFWWSVAALFDIIHARAIDDTFSLKQLLARIDLQIRRLTEGSNNIAERLWRETLYFIALSGNPVNERVQKVQQSFHLVALLPSASHGENALVVYRVIRELQARVNVLKNIWARVIGGQLGLVGNFRGELMAACKHTAASSYPEMQVIFDVLSRGVAHFPPRQNIPEAIAMEYATALLFAEDVFAQYGNPITGLPQQIRIIRERIDMAFAGQMPPPLDSPQFGEITRRAEDKILLPQLARDIQANLRHMEQELDLFFRDNRQRQGLADLAKDGQEISGALRVLGHSEADELLHACMEQIASYLDPETPLVHEDFELLAESLSALGFYVEALEHRRPQNEMLIRPLLNRYRRRGGQPPSDDEPPSGGVPPQGTSFGEGRAFRTEPSVGGAAAQGISTSAETKPLRAEADLSDREIPALQEEETPQQAEPEPFVEALPEEVTADIAPEEAKWGETVTVEELVNALHRLGEQLRMNPSDQSLLALIDKNVQTLYDDTRLVGNAPLFGKVKAIREIRKTGDVATLTVMLENILDTPVIEPPSEETQRLLRVDANELDAELLDIYLAEAIEVLDGVRKNEALLTSSPGDIETLRNIRRAFHTLKGSGRMVGLSELGELAYDVEKIHNKLLEMGYPATSAVLAMIGTAEREFRSWIETLERTKEVTPDPRALHAVIATVETELAGGAAPTPPPVVSVAPPVSTPPLAETKPVMPRVSITPPPASVASSAPVSSAPIMKDDSPLSKSMLGTASTKLRKEAPAFGEALELKPEGKVEVKRVAGTPPEITTALPVVDESSPLAKVDSVLPKTSDVGGGPSSQPQIIAQSPSKREDDGNFSLDVFLKKSAPEKKTAPIEERIADTEVLFEIPLTPRKEPERVADTPTTIGATTLDAPKPSKREDDGNFSLDVFLKKSAPEKKTAPIEERITDTEVLFEIPLMPRKAQERVADMTIGKAKAKQERENDPLSISVSLPQSERIAATPREQKLFERISEDEIVMTVPLARSRRFAEVGAHHEPRQPSKTDDDEIINIQIPLTQQAQAHPTGKVELHIADHDVSVVDVRAELTPPPPLPPQKVTAGNITMAAGRPAARASETLAGQPASDDVHIGNIVLSQTLYKLFIEEASQHWSVLNRQMMLMRIDTSRVPDEEMIRAAHTLASIHSTTGFMQVFDVAKALELLLIAAKERIKTGAKPILRMIPVVARAVSGLRVLMDRIAAREVFAAAEEREAEAIVVEIGLLQEREMLQVPDRVTDAEEAILRKEAEIDHVEPTLPENRRQPVTGAPDTSSPPVAESGDTAQWETQSAEIPADADIDVKSLLKDVFKEQQRPVSEVAGERDGLLVLRDEIDAQLLPLFLEESRDLYNSMANALHMWRVDIGNENELLKLKRSLHTLKGSARMVGAMQLGELAHKMETRVDEGKPDETLFATLEEGLEHIEYVLKRLRAGETNISFPWLKKVEETEAEAESERETAVSELTANLGDDKAQADEILAKTDQMLAPTIKRGETLSSTELPQTQKSEMLDEILLRVPSSRVDQLVNETGEVIISRTRAEGELRELKGDLLELTNSVIRLRQNVRTIEIEAESQIQAQLEHMQEIYGKFDPLEFDRYTKLQEMTRSLAEGVNDVSTIQQAMLGHLDTVNQALFAQSRISREVQQSLFAIRTVPFSSVNDRLYRIQRSLTKELQKRANLEIKGGQHELDRAILDRLIVPLEHLLRNSLDHGIEVPEIRRAAGKPEYGEITIDVGQAGNEIVVAISDDGAGLSLEKAREKARAKGMDEAKLDEAQLLNLIFEPGFSTAKTITAISGRGIGLDIVRSEISSLGGRIEVSSVPGKGTRFTIFLPLTVAVSQTVLLRGTQTRTWAIPVAMVEQVEHVSEETLTAMYRTGEAVQRGETYSFFYFDRLVDRADTLPEITRYNPVIFLRTGHGRVAVHVDQIVGNQEVVIKSVGTQQVRRVPGLLGATILGTGEVVLIVDPIRLAQRDEIPAAMAQRSAAIGQSQAEDDVDAKLVLIVDDSLTIRKVTSRLMVREGYAVETAKDGFDALKVLTERRPDIILLDIEMPRMDGFEFAKLVKSDSKLWDIPIIMITSRTADKHREHAEELGVEAYFGKPYQEEELLKSMRELLKEKVVH